MRISASSFAAIGTAANIAFFAAILIVLVGGWQIVRMHDAQLVSAEQDARNLSRSLSQHAARTLEGVDLILAETIEHVEGSADRAGLKRYLERRAGHAAQIRSIVVTNAAGDWIADTLGPHDRRTSADRDYFAWHRDHADNTLHIADDITARDGSSAAIPLSRRINNADGSFAGLVVAGLVPEYLQSFYRSVHLGAQGSVALFSTQGQVIVRYPGVTDTANSDTARANRDMKLFAAASGVYRLRSRFDGIERIFAFEHVEGYPLVVSAGVAIDDVLAEWRREASIEGAVLAIAVMVLVALGLGLERHRRRTSALESVSRELNRQYRLLAENSTDLIALRPAFSERYDYVSQSSNSIVGWEPGELAALPTKEYIHPDDLERVAGEFAALTPETPRVSSLHRVRHKAGHFVWLEAVFQLSGGGTTQQSIMVAARDVTARQKAEQALKESEARYRILADSTSDVITRLDLNLVRQYASPACRSVLGWEPEDMVGQTSTQSIHPDDVAEVLARVTRLAAGEVDGDRAAAIYRARHKLGHWVWIESAMTLLRDNDTGSAISVICSLRDVTERQRAARDLEEAKGIAERAAVAKAEFLADMSHELRTPLTGMLGVHDLLRSDPTLSVAQRRLAGLASASGRSLLNIVNDVLDLSKMGAGQLAIERVPFELRSLVDDCRDLAAEGLKGKPVRIEAVLDGDESRWFVGDPTRLKQVLLNLLTNATKFTEQGEIVIHVTYSAAMASVRFDVRDTGIGIPADKLPTLFERFRQAEVSTPRRYGGTGLGLAISKQLVELMGGSIGVESRVGQGSRFWFDIPMQHHDGAIEPTLLATLDAVRQIPRRILLAEDNVVNQEIISAMLSSRAHIVTVVSDGAAAVAALRRGPAFDVVLMDVQMLGMDGLSATRAIRQLERLERRSRTPVLGLSANVMPDDVARCLDAGMDGHLAKPIDWGQFLAEIDRVVSPGDAGGSAGTFVSDQNGDVLSSTALDALDRIIGRDRLGEMLAAFVAEVDRRLADLDQANAAQLSTGVHSLTSLSGQLGFMELSKLCAGIEDEARLGGGLQRLAELRAAAARAVTAARASPYAQAA